MTPAFQTTDEFSADSGAPGSNPILYGVGPGEKVGIVFDLKMKSASEYFNFNDVIAAINLGFTNPGDTDALRIGIHVQNLPGYDKNGVWGDTYGSESFIMTPIPATILLGLLGLGMGGWKLRKSL